MISTFHNSKENTAKYGSQCIENRPLNKLYKYIMKRKNPSTNFWECRGQNVLHALGNDTKASFQKNIPGKVQFQKKKRVLPPPPPPSHYPHPVLSSLGGVGTKQCFHSSQKYFPAFCIFLELV